MAGLEHRCRQTEDPRYPGYCACGERLPGGYRDPSGYEATFLAESAKRAEKRFVVATAGFQLGVERRLEMGQERYGNTFQSLHPLERARNILEEAWDAGAYAVLDAQVRIAAGFDDPAAWHLFEIAQHAAAIDAHARQLNAD